MGFEPRVLEAAAKLHEVTLTTRGRKTGRPARVTLWVATDGERMFIRSGAGMGRHWPQNLLAAGRGSLRLGRLSVDVEPRHVTEIEEARVVSRLVRLKYGAQVMTTRPGEAPGPAELATFELRPLAKGPDSRP